MSKTKGIAVWPINLSFTSQAPLYPQKPITILNLSEFRISLPWVWQRPRCVQEKKFCQTSWWHFQIANHRISRVLYISQFLWMQHFNYLCWPLANFLFWGEIVLYWTDPHSNAALPSCSHVQRISCWGASCGQLGTELWETGQWHDTSSEDLWLKYLKGNRASKRGCTVKAGVRAAADWDP